MTPMEVVLLGMAGGLLPDAIRMVKERYDAEVPAFLRSPKFYASLGLCVLLGGFAAWLLQAETTKDAVIYGFAGPELLTRLASTAAGSVKDATVLRGGPPTAQPRHQETLLAWWGR